MISRAILIVVLLVLTACEASVSYKPPIPLPITFTINHRGEISVEISRSFTTFIGTFEIGATIPAPGSNSIMLIIRDMNTTPPDKVYKIDVGRNLTVTTNGQTVVSVDAKGVVVVDITNGRVQSIEINDGDIVRVGADGRPQCAGVASRFTVGESVYVDFNDRGALRILTDFRGGANQTLVQAYDDNLLELIRGPICYQGVWYWWIYYPHANIEGWVAEGASGQVYLCPSFQKECA